MNLATAASGRRVVLIDFEFTCWPDSLATGWADPARPPEILELGVAAYDPTRGGVGQTFSTPVRPAINPALSDYCLALLPITQIEIDGAPDLAAAARRLVRWLDVHCEPGDPTCGWGDFDRPVLAQDAERVGIADPLGGRPHIDMQAVVGSRLLGESRAREISREGAQDALGLGRVKGRHRALNDALDLADLDRALRRAEC